MAIFYQQDINETTRLGIWRIDEDEAFFKTLIPLHRNVTHPHKRLQHLAGRFLLKYLFPDFPAEQIEVADTKKPFLPNETYHFSISHCDNYAAAIVSKNYRVGIDIEIASEKVVRVQHKFVNETESAIIRPLTIENFTQMWCAKEAVFKWYGEGQVDFKQHIQLQSYLLQNESYQCLFTKNNTTLNIWTKQFDALCLSYIYT